MWIRLGLVAAAMLAGAMAFAGSADAGRLKFRYYAYDPDYDYYYGPEYLPRPSYYRYFQRDPAYDDDEQDYSYDPDYYEPQYLPQRKRRAYLAPDSRPPVVRKKQASISCAKASEIVSGFGFKSVEQVTCKGPTYAFNATRDGKPFSIKLNSASGELTEVKKVK